MYQITLVKVSRETGTNFTAVITMGRWVFAINRTKSFFKGFESSTHGEQKTTVDTRKL